MQRLITKFPECNLLDWHWSGPSAFNPVIQQNLPLASLNSAVRPYWFPELVWPTDMSGTWPRDDWGRSTIHSSHLPTHRLIHDWLVSSMLAATLAIRNGSPARPPVRPMARVPSTSPQSPARFPSTAPPARRPSPVLRMVLSRGVATDFLVGWGGGGGPNRRRGGQPTPKYPKNRKNTGFWPLHSRIWGSTHPVFKSAGVRTPDPLPRERASFVT